MTDSQVRDREDWIAQGVRTVSQSASSIRKAEIVSSLCSWLAKYVQSPPSQALGHRPGVHMRLELRSSGHHNCAVVLIVV